MMLNFYKILGQNNIDLGDYDLGDDKKLRIIFEQIKQGYRGKLKNEFFEVLNSEGQKTGSIKLRDLIHREGDWHGAFHLHLFSTLNGEPELLLQKRRYDKDVCPNKLDTVAAGHYSIGEEVIDGVREVDEEIGLDVDFDQLTNLGKRKNYDPQPENNIKNFEFQDVCVLKCDQPLEKYRLQASELAGILKVNVEEFINLMLKRTDLIKTKEAFVFREDGNLQEAELDVTRDDIWPAPYDNYYLKTAMLISLLSKGVKIPKNPLRYDVTNYIK